MPAVIAFSELVERPREGRIFHLSLRPGIADVTGRGRARLDAIARWLQDVAYRDLVDARLDGRGVWIVRRLRIRVESFPRFDEELELRTFCSGLGRFAAERRTTIAGGSAAVETAALWIYLDPDGWRPIRLEKEFFAAYGRSAGEQPAPVRLRHPEPPADAARGGWRFRASDIDIAGHVNNSHYWEVLEEDLAGGPEPERIDAEIEHRAPGEAGEAFVLRAGESLWITSPSGQLHASILRGS